MKKGKKGISRKGFLKAAAGATAAATAGFNILHSAHAGNADALKVGLLGCGGRGRSGAVECLTSSPNVRLIAMADVFQWRIDETKVHIQREMKKAGGLDRYAVKDDLCFVGFDAHKRLFQTDIDIALLITPPVFRPQTLEAAIEAGKHVFMEKPACVDAPGARRMIAAGEKAREKKLNVAAGSQRRHRPDYIATIKKIQDGAIGEITSACVWWCGGRYGFEGKKDPAWSDMEYMLRSWYGWRWLSGDHFVEQHVHNLDVMTWVFGKYPKAARAMGSRLRRQVGDCYDNFAADFVFDNDVHVLSMARQMPGCWGHVGELVVGTKGRSNCSNEIWDLQGKSVWKFSGDSSTFRGGYVEEHADLIAAIRGEAPYLNEAGNIARSTLMGIMGRTSAYTGKEVKWDEAMAMEEKWGPEKLELGPVEIPPLPIPGQPV